MKNEGGGLLRGGLGDRWTKEGEEPRAEMDENGFNWKPEGGNNVGSPAEAPDRVRGAPWRGERRGRFGGWKEGMAIEAVVLNPRARSSLPLPSLRTFSRERTAPLPYTC